MLRNEAQLTHFPCSPALSTSCLFIELHIAMLPQQDFILLPVSSCLWINIFQKPGKLCQGCWGESAVECRMQTFQWSFIMLLGCYCLLFRSSEQFSLRVQSISISEPSSDSLAIQSLRKQRGYIPHCILSSRLIWRPMWGILQHCLISYDSAVWITDSSAFRFPLTVIPQSSIGFTLYDQKWQGQLVFNKKKNL